MKKAEEELYHRPQISKQHFYVAMSALPDNSVRTYIGKDFENKLMEQHAKYGLHMSPRY